MASINAPQHKNPISRKFLNISIDTQYILHYNTYIDCYIGIFKMSEIICQFRNQPTVNGAFVVEKDGTFTRIIVKQSKQGFVIVERLHQNIDFREFESDENIPHLNANSIVVLTGNYLVHQPNVVQKLTDTCEILFDKVHNCVVRSSILLISEYTKKRAFNLW